MKIALVYPRWSETYGEIAHLARKAGTFPPLNLCYLAAIAEQDSHRIEIIDGEAEGIANERIVARIVQSGPDLVGITSTTPFHHLAVDLARDIKDEMAVPIAIGGAHVTAMDDAEPCFDYYFVGEAERSWRIFLNEFPPPTRSAPPMPMDINDLPIPARHLLDPSLYNMGTQEGIKRFTSIMTMRGCPFKCIFCSRRVFGNDARRRSPASVIEEMRECKERYGIEHFFFLDDVLTLSRAYTMQLCELILDARLDVTWEGSTCADRVDEELIRKMWLAGLIRLSYGLETVDETMRATMKKNVPLKAYIEANRLTNKYGIETINSCMIGLPGETEETVKKLLRFLREHKDIKLANVSIAVPYPGTELYEWAREGSHGIKLVTDDFSEFRRYNAAVMQVGDLLPEDLIRIQNEAYASIYMFSPHRWQAMIGKYGMEGAELTAGRLMRAIDEGQPKFLTNKQLGVQ